MRVLLVEPDYYARYPPLGLLKIATYHRSIGDQVFLVRGCVEVPRPDLIYVTSLFTYAWKPVHDAVQFYKKAFPGVRVLLGGIYASLLPEHAATSGADQVHVGLKPEIEDLLPSWDLIPEWDGSILFASRGCIRKCGFCSVPKLEGPPDNLRDRIAQLIYPPHSRIILWDNNILGNSNWEPIFDEVERIGKAVDFNQGLDARLVTDRMAEKLARLRLDSVRMAYDYPGLGGFLRRAVERLEAAGINRRRIVVYTLYNYIDDPENFRERVTELLSLGVTSYPMRFEPLTSLEKNAWISPKWTKERLEQVAVARRVLGFAGAFPPYEGLVKKLRRAKDFDQAFSLRARRWKARGKPRRKNPRYAGPVDWLSYVRQMHVS